MRHKDIGGQQVRRRPIGLTSMVTTLRRLVHDRLDLEDGSDDKGCDRNERQDVREGPLLDAWVHRYQWDRY